MALSTLQSLLASYHKVLQCIVDGINLYVFPMGDSLVLLQDQVVLLRYIDSFC